MTDDMTEDCYQNDNSSGSIHVTRTYKQHDQCWKVSFQIKDCRVGSVYDFSEHVKLSKTASKKEVVDQAILQITRMWGRMIDIWLPNVSKNITNQ